MTRIEHAIIFATKAHEGQLRKDNVTPYIVHPLGVAESVRRFGGSEDQYIAALLHDTVEDCGVTPEEITSLFGKEVSDLVIELTNVYVKEAFPDLNRADRKRLEDERIAKISPEAMLVKICDIAYNIHDLDGLGGFRNRLLEEKANTMDIICDNSTGRILDLAIDVEQDIIRLLAA